MGWWNFPQWEVIATQRGENGFTVITAVGMGSILFTGEWVEDQLVMPHPDFSLVIFTLNKGVRL